MSYNPIFYNYISSKDIHYSYICYNHNHIFYSYITYYHNHISYNLIF
jgi:hypothetical protein